MKEESNVQLRDVIDNKYTAQEANVAMDILTQFSIGFTLRGRFVRVNHEVLEINCNDITTKTRQLLRYLGIDHVLVIQRCIFSEIQALIQTVGQHSPKFHVKNKMTIDNENNLYIDRLFQ